jgi:predicted dithiol-disulfide oxidoreductase (DUF899 family)
MPTHETCGREEWLAARRDLLAREKQLTRLSDEVARERLALPWVEVDKPYSFETPAGTKSLEELFDGRSQLLVYHFMYSPEIDGGFCKSCSLTADHLDGPLPHLNARDVTLTCASRAPLDEIESYRERMGWAFPWASSLGSDFNYDFQASFTDEQRAGREPAEYNFAPIDEPFAELPGWSAFALEDGVVYHTYSSYARGGEPVMGVYALLDRAPRGRDEDALPWPMAWVRRHDEYEQAIAS